MAEKKYKFIVDDKVFEKLDNVCFGVVIASNIDNNKYYDFISKMIEDNTNKIRDYYQNNSIREDIHISCYRDAFVKLGINPNKYMCSIEALVSRVVKGHDLPNINPIVDLGNALSLKYKIPLGAHDINKFTDNICLRFANGTDEFIPFGSEEKEIVDKDEIIYVTGNEVKTRKWTHRQGEKGKITEDTNYVFFPIDGFTDVNKEEVLELRDELADILKNKLDANVEIGFVDKNNKYFEI